MAEIEVSNLFKKLGGKVVLRDISFSIEEGDCFCLLGPNGAGKTTTLRILGILRPDSGNVYVKGLDVYSHINEIRSMIGYLPENPFLYDRLSIWDNLEFYGKLYDVPSKELKNRINMLIDMFKLKDRVSDKVGTLSKGLRQRVALIRSLLHDPSILLLDQPTSDLDPVMAKSIRDIIRSLNKEEGKTILVCTHNLNEAEELCDKAAIINMGVLLGVGSIADIKKNMISEHIFKISTLTPMTKYINLLKSLDYVVDFHIIDDYNVYVRLRNRNDVSMVIERLVNNECKIFEVKFQEPKLEDVFIKMVKENEVR